MKILKVAAIIVGFIGLGIAIGYAVFRLYSHFNPIATLQTDMTALATATSPTAKDSPAQNREEIFTDTDFKVALNLPRDSFILSTDLSDYNSRRLQIIKQKDASSFVISGVDIYLSEASYSQHAPVNTFQGLQNSLTYGMRLNYNLNNSLATTKTTSGAVQKDQGATLASIQGVKENHYLDGHNNAFTDYIKDVGSVKVLIFRSVSADNLTELEIQSLINSIKTATTVPDTTPIQPDNNSSILLEPSAIAN